MRILFVGAFSKHSSVYSYADSFVRAFKSLGHDVKVVNYRSGKSFFMNQRLKYEAYIQKPDLIFILKGELIYASTISWLRKKVGAYLVNFYPDNPFTLWNGNSTIEIITSITYYDCWLIWSEKLVDLLYAAGAQRVVYFPFGFDEQLFYPAHEVSLKQEVSFVGSWEPEREKILSSLLARDFGIPLAIWGNGWIENCRNDLLMRHYRGAARYFTELLAIIHRSAISLNMMRRQNLDAHNMRTCEIPAAGAFLLTERTREQAEKLFVEDKELVCFSSGEELYEKILFYLQHPTYREAIAREGTQRVQQYQLKKLLKSWSDGQLF